MTRLCCISLAFFACACLPTVGPWVDSGQIVPEVDGGCSSALECASGVCEATACVAPASVCAPAFAGCATFVDLTDPASVRVIRFGATERYAPNCIRIRFGQTVTFQGGDFGVHPLSQSCGPVAGVLVASSGQSFTLTFNRGLGIFGYYCFAHGSPAGAGMAGAIEVVR